MKKHKLIEVTWRDANGYPIQELRTGDFKLAQVRTVGYLMKKNKHRIIVAMELIRDGMGEDVRGVMVIPRENVIKVRRLRR